MNKLILLLVLSLLATGVKAQTHTFPAEDTNNVFTGTNTFPSINKVIYIDGTVYACTSAGLNAAISALPANGGTVDARYCLGTYPIASTVTVGSSTKTVTLMLDRTGNPNCTITNGTNCFYVGPGSAIIAPGGVVTNPNAGLTFATNASIQSGIELENLNGGNYVGSLLDGLFVLGNSTMTVSDAVVSYKNPLQITQARNITIAGPVNGILLKIYCGVGLSCGNAEFDNIQIDGQGGTGNRPVWIGCTTTNSTTLGSCGGIYSVSFQGPSAVVHPGSGHPIFDVEGSNGAGGLNPIENINWSGTQMESRNTSDVGILLSGVSSAHMYGIVATCNTNCGTDIIKLDQPSGTALDGIDIRGLTNQGGWTHTLNNTVISKTIATTSINYEYTKDFSATQTNVWDDGNGNQATIDTGGVAGRTFIPNSYTVSTLPSASASGAGAMVIVTDASSFTVGTCTGSGSDTMIAVSNGTSWTCH